MSEKAKNLLIAAMLLSGMSGGEYMGMDWADGDDWTVPEETQEEQEDGASNQADR